MRALSLFSGAAGGDLGLLRAGIDVIAHCEIEPHAQAVLRYHFPGVPLHDDVTTLDGTAYRGRVDIVVGGSPCQDLSVAGQRAGLEGARSGLFHEQIRIWNETEAPNILWENVFGALSSNDGADFAVILGAIVGASVPVPSDGWRSAGVVAGPTGVAAWRVLDLQHFGPPQRRRRVFVFGARAGGLDPEQILLEPPSLRGHPPARGEAGQAAASRAGAGAEVESEREAVMAFDTFNQKEDPRAFPSLCAGGGDPPAVMAFDTTQVTHPENRSRPEPGKPCHALSASAHPPAVLCVTGERTHALTSEGADASEDGTGRGTPIVLASGQANAERSTNGVAPTLTLLHKAPIVAGTLAASGAGTARPAGQSNETDLIVVGTLESRSSAGGFPGTDGATAGHVVPSAGIPRRLMPIECERLMGWGDDWTRYGRREDGTVYELSDSARYRLCGNGIGAPVTHWIGLRAMALLTALTEAA